MKKITKAVIPAAGWGTRFLPQTKAMPKEMLPLIDKPIIQYVVEDAVAAGITDIIIVTGAHKRSVEDHFDHQYELEAKLRQDGKTEMADNLARIADMANFIYIRQKGPYGNGTPILNAAHLLDDEPFLVLWADEVFDANPSRATQLVQAYEQLGGPVVGLMEIDKADVSKYGIADPKNQIDDKTYVINGLVEKPAADKAPSLLAGLGGYVLDKDVIDVLDKLEIDESGELFLTRAIDVVARKKPVYGKVIDGIWHDTGDKAKYIEAIIDQGLKDPKIGPGLRDFIKSRLQ